jgi:uncharacterized protein (UPF0333 family)
VIEDNKGQVSLEFILVVGAIMTMTIVGIPMILKNTEMNKGLSAARDGATYGAAMRGVGYAGSGVSSQPSGVVKIDRIEYTITENPGSLNNVSIRIYAKIPSNMDTTSICDTIETQAQRYVAYALHGRWISGAVVQISERTGSYYVFAPIGCYVSS